MIDFIREFKFGRPQQFAALLLVAYLGLAIFVHPTVSTRDMYLYDDQGHYQVRLPQVRCVERDQRIIEPCYVDDDFVLLQRIAHPSARLGFWVQNRIATTTEATHVFWVENTLRLPFLFFGLSLGGAIWWVSRRLYNDAGGYVALALFCFSWWMLLFGVSVYAEVIAAWGLYGMVYTGIGVAHTLYAPSRKWRPRIVLLGLAFGVTACAHLLAFAIGVLLCTAFMLYLAPGRRVASLTTVGVGCAAAFLIMLALYGFNLSSLLVEIRSWQAWGIRGFYPGWQWSMVGFREQEIWLLELLGLALGAFLVWKRTRYFGNIVPLIVALSLVFIRGNNWLALPWIWSLPFLFTFIGGICADLFESRYGIAWRVAVPIIIAAYAIAGILGLRPAYGF